MHCSQISKVIPRNCRALGNQVKCWFSPPCSGHPALVLLTTLPRSPQTISLVITCLVFLGPSLLEPLSVCSNLECSFELFCLFQDSLLLFVCLCFSFSGACQKTKSRTVATTKTCLGDQVSVPRMSKTVPVLSSHLFDWTKNSSVLPSQDNVTVTIDNPCLPVVHTACLCHSLLITPTVPEYRSFYCIQ